MDCNRRWSCPIKSAETQVCKGQLAYRGKVAGPRRSQIMGLQGNEKIVKLRGMCSVWADGHWLPGSVPVASKEGKF